MARLVIIGGILSMIITFGIISSVYLHNTMVGVNEVLEEISANCSAENEAAAREKTNELSAFWKSRQSILNLFMRRGELDSIASLMCDLTSYVDAKSFEGAHVEIRRISLTINHMYEREVPSIDNIF